MRHESRPPPRGPTRGPYLLAPIASRHRECSRQMILRAAGAVPAGRAAVLGAGACEEIPLVELVDRFGEVVLNDIDEKPLHRAFDGLGWNESRPDNLSIQIADLSGMTQPTLERIGQTLAKAKDTSSAISAMAQVLEDVPAGRFPIAAPFDLIVASCVLGQLHVTLTHESAALFEARFPGQVETLRQADAWKSAIANAARRMEDAFVTDMASLLPGGGLLYLSESAQVCFVELLADGRWRTEGTYRMLRSKDLGDYVGQHFRIIGRDRWEWVVFPPSNPGDIGRLFDVQALVLGAR